MGREHLPHYAVASSATAQSRRSAISGGSDERIGDFAEENLGCLGPDAFVALQPFADFLSCAGSAPQKGYGAVVIRDWAAHHVWQLFAHDGAQSVIVALP